MERKRPAIGLTTSEVRRPNPEEKIPHAEVQREEMALGMSYSRALAGAGGAPVVLPPLGVEVGPSEAALDRFEIAVVHEAERLGMPLLAICRGAQVLNVAHGGDLRQHLPEDPGTDVAHRRERPDDPPVSHDVRIEPGSLLAHVLGAERLEVNSFHHQAPARVGEGLRAVAWAPVGVIEGLEAPGREFEVGVQWHAEAMVERLEQRALFEAFVEAASAYADRTASTARSASASHPSGSAGATDTSATGIR
jgi:putative glutamine amidotransferase